MSEKKVKEVLDWLEDENGEVATLWGMQQQLENPEDKEVKEALLKIFNEQQLRVLNILLKNVIGAYKFHETFEEAHMDIRDTVKNVDAKLRNHRHELDKNYSAKPEF